jgi:acetyl esterase/lipase
VTESAWLDLLDSVDGSIVTPSGLTVGELREFHTRPDTPPGAVFTLRVPYGPVDDDGRPLTLSLYARADLRERRPAVVFVHGGGWSGGDPYFHIRHAHALAALGYVTATISYRVYPEVRWPSPLYDVAAAVRWMRTHAEEVGADPARIAVGGGSAGGHLAAWCGLSSARLDSSVPPLVSSERLDSSVQALVSWYPVVDVNAMRFTTEQEEGRRNIAAFFGGSEDAAGEGAAGEGAAGEAARREASPLYAVHAGCPPVLTMTGSADSGVPVETIRVFHAALDAVGVPNQLEVFDGRDHSFDILASFSDWQSCVDVVVTFLDDLWPDAVAGKSAHSAAR